LHEFTGDGNVSGIECVTRFFQRFFESRERNEFVGFRNENAESFFDVGNLYFF
jgi:hypothetical protein